MYVTHIDSLGIPAGEVAYFKLSQNPLDDAVIPSCPYPTANLTVENFLSSIWIIDPKTDEAFILTLGQYKADNGSDNL
jgi:hypothetical protein